jgi:hypothetical protein
MFRHLIIPDIIIISKLRDIAQVCCFCFLYFL